MHPFCDEATRNIRAHIAPPVIVGKLNQAVNAILADAKLQTRLAELGGEPMPMTPAEFGELVAEETEKWGKVIRAAKIKAE
jgi:tripartite-type tricarboxylate transporter receptor subunit TctC